MDDIIIIKDYRDSKRLLKESSKKGVLTLENFPQGGLPRAVSENLKK